MSFNKNPRSQISRSLSASYNFFERDLSPEMIAENDYAKYNIWNLGFVYSDNNVIREKYIFGNFQYMEDYAKLTAESYYRLEYAKNKKLSLRFYGGYFLKTIPEIIILTSGFLKFPTMLSLIISWLRVQLAEYFLSSLLWQKVVLNLILTER